MEEPGVAQGAAEVGGEALATRRCFSRVSIISRVQRAVKLSVRTPIPWAWAPKQPSTSRREVRGRPTAPNSKAQVTPKCVQRWEFSVPLVLTH